ncbi:hypothetical protein COCON_G00110110 [Conger conger]|uniref:Uncharacterized protein n=1 Tax=Conger conger TaxID=82655 RepID=A0A9Q1DJF7_CONCO|nr:hypothetical protein COCON_G00110110 [Conger conger]
MDVRLYPSASGNPIPGDPSNLSFHHCLGYFDYNKFGNHNSYMNMAEANGALLPADDRSPRMPRVSASTRAGAWPPPGRALAPQSAAVARPPGILGQCLARRRALLG